MARTSKKTSNKKGIVSVDFTGVQKGFVKVPTGTYRAKLIEIEQGVSGADNPKLDWTFEIIGGKYEGQKPLPYQTSLTPQSLWNLRGVLEAGGIEIEESAMDLNLAEILEEFEECYIEIRQETYNEKEISKISSVLPAEDETDEEDADEEEEAPKRKPQKAAKETPKGKKGKVVEDEEEDEEDEAEDDGDDITEADILKMGEDELEGVIEDFDLDVDLEDYEKLVAKRKAVAKAFAEADQGDDEEEDEAEGYSEADIMDMSTKQLAEVIKTNKLKVDLEAAGNTRKKRKAVVSALEKAGLIK